MMRGQRAGNVNWERPIEWEVFSGRDREILRYPLLANSTLNTFREKNFQKNYFPTQSHT